MVNPTWSKAEVRTACGAGARVTEDDSSELAGWLLEAPGDGVSRWMVASGRKVRTGSGLYAGSFALGAAPGRR